MFDDKNLTIIGLFLVERGDYVPGAICLIVAAAYAFLQK
jgi:hypothetical protein